MQKGAKVQNSKQRANSNVSNSSYRSYTQKPETLTQLLKESKTNGQVSSRAAEHEHPRPSKSKSRMPSNQARPESGKENVQPAQNSQ